MAKPKQRFNLSNSRWMFNPHIDTCLQCEGVLEPDDDVLYIPAHLGFLCKTCGEKLLPKLGITHAGQNLNSIA